MGTTRLSAEGAVGRGLSPAIWQAYGFIGGNQYDPSLIPFFFDDFAKLGVYTTVTSQDGYITVQDTSVTVASSADADNSEGEFGVLKIYHDGTAHDEGNIELGGGTGGLLRIDPTVGERAVVAMEARVKVTLVTVGSCCFALGIGEPGIYAADMIVDTTGALVSKDFVGFQTLLTSNSEIDTIYRKAGQTLAQVKDNAATMAADTWIKLGFVYDPFGPANKKLTFFADGVALGDSVTDAIVTAGTVFPTDEEMTLCLGTKILTASATAFYMDWWACGSYLVDG
jgi:hypothetical protein